MLARQARPVRLTRPRRSLAFDVSAFHSSARNGVWLKTKLEDRRLLRLSGENSQSFLQGLITNNVKRVETSPEDRSAVYTGFLTPPGRLQFDGFIYPDQHGGLLIDHHSNQTEQIRNWLLKFVLRSRVKISVDPRDIWAIWPSRPDGPADDLAVLNPPLSNQSDDSIWKDRRGDKRLGYRLLVNPATVPNSLDHLRNAPLSAYTLHVLLRASLPPTLSTPYPINFPFEANLDHHDAIDFRKGCYIGQELTARTYHTGVIRKRLVVVSIGKSNQQQSPGPTGLSPTIPYAFCSLNTRIERSVHDHDHHRKESPNLPEPTPASCQSETQQNLELFINNTTTIDSQSKSERSIGRLCGPIISTTTSDEEKEGDDRVQKHLMFSLALLRIDHDLFNSHHGQDWSSISLKLQNNSHDCTNENWVVQPIKPHWWPS